MISYKQKWVLLTVLATVSDKTKTKQLCPVGYLQIWLISIKWHFCIRQMWTIVIHHVVRHTGGPWAAAFHLMDDKRKWSLNEHLKT